MPKARVRQLLDLLIGEYGRRRWQPDHDPLSTLVQTILSQNTSDANSGRAFESLLAAFPTWEDVAAAEEGAIADAIRSGGLGNIKARRIKQALQEIREKSGGLDLDFLRELPLEQARDWLKRLPGVGTKTANCVFLFSLGRPALPVDTHVFRVTKRLGLVGSRLSVEQVSRRLEELVPPEDVYQFHMLVIEHGRRVCRAQRPACLECVLAVLCPSYGALVVEAGKGPREKAAPSR